MGKTRGHDGSRHTYKKEQPSHSSNKKFKQYSQHCKRTKVNSIMSNINVENINTNDYNAKDIDILDFDVTDIPNTINIWYKCSGYIRKLS